MRWEARTPMPWTWNATRRLLYEDVGELMRKGRVPKEDEENGEVWKIRERDPYRANTFQEDEAKTFPYPETFKIS
jgi:hypothetical protein